jgi:hypothetical protein
MRYNMARSELKCSALGILSNVNFETMSCAHDAYGQDPTCQIIDTADPDIVITLVTKLVK